MFNGSRAYVLTEASRTRKHPKRAEVDEESSDPIESRTYGSLTVEIPMRKSPKHSTPDGEDLALETKRAKVIKLHSIKSLSIFNSIAISKPDAEDSYGTCFILICNLNVQNSSERQKGEHCFEEASILIEHSFSHCLEEGAKEELLLAENEKKTRTPRKAPTTEEKEANKKMLLKLVGTVVVKYDDGKLDALSDGKALKTKKFVRGTMEAREFQEQRSRFKEGNGRDATDWYMLL
ncbi:hypothetical protein M405DRAFT_879974 [Rhizopogon salebrosus TDB-379]|nr:hypothetical protein M405DRAFT_879974 [Rhizopogon salebrosus TDB-379]